MGIELYPTLSLTSALDGVGGQRHAPAALTPGKTRYPLYRRLGGPQGRSGQVRKISATPVFDPRTVQPVASRYIAWVIPVSIDCYREKVNFKFGHPVVFLPNNYISSCRHTLFCIHHDRSGWPVSGKERCFPSDVPPLLANVPVRRCAPRSTLPIAPVRLPRTTCAKQSPPPPSQVTVVLVSSSA